MVTEMNIQELSISERILLAEQLWESVRAEVSEVGLTEEQRQALDERLAAYELDGNVGDAWECVKQRLLNS